jgi:hypothetical protein
MFANESREPFRHTRTAVEGGGPGTSTARIAPCPQPARECAPAAVRAERLAVAACVGAAAVLWGALVWVLAAALEVPTPF